MSTEKIYGVDNKIGIALKSTRKMLAMTQAELAVILGITNDYVSKIEKGEREPRDYLLSRIQKFIGGDVTISINESAENYEPEPLTFEELELLRRFRNLDDRHKQNVMEMISGYEALSVGIQGKKSAAGGS